MITGHLEMIEAIKKTMNLVADLSGWKRCAAITEAISQLDALAGGIKKAEEAHEKTIELLEKQLENARKTPDDAAETLGGETYNIDLR